MWYLENKNGLYSDERANVLFLSGKEFEALKTTVEEYLHPVIMKPGTAFLKFKDILEKDVKVLNEKNAGYPTETEAMKKGLTYKLVFKADDCTDLFKCLLEILENKVNRLCRIK